MEEPAIQRERIQNLWVSFARKFPPVANSTGVVAEPTLDFDSIGGLLAAKEELLTYACAATDPEVYARWGTLPPSALMLIGRTDVGKGLLANALATRTQTGFLRVDVPRFVLEVLHWEGKVAELLAAWKQALDELPAVTVFFDELEFSQAEEIGTRRTDLPIGQIMDLLLELVDRTIAVDDTLVVGSTAHPHTLRQAFIAPGRFERVVEVAPVFPEDIVTALVIHAEAAEKRAGRPLFRDVDWTQVVSRFRHESTGDWIRVMHAALRSKARCEAAGETVTPVSTEDMLREVERLRHAQTRLLPAGGSYI